MRDLPAILSVLVFAFFFAFLSPLFAGAAVASEPRAGVENAARAKVNYLLHCQGCHGPDGAGTADGAVPAMKNFVGNFLNIDEGRAFLVRVPGSANSALSDTALAEVLNWMLWEMSSNQIPARFEPYTAAEVSAFRARPLKDVAVARASLIARMGNL